MAVKAVSMTMISGKKYGVMKVKSPTYGTYETIFMKRDWRKFRKGSGKGSKVTQEVMQEFYEYLG